MHRVPKGRQNCEDASFVPAGTPQCGGIRPSTQVPGYCQPSLTRRGFAPASDPQVETHGYRHALATRGGSGITPTMSPLTGLGDFGAAIPSTKMPPLTGQGRSRTAWKAYPRTKTSDPIWAASNCSCPAREPRWKFCPLFAFDPPCRNIANRRCCRDYHPS